MFYTFYQNNSFGVFKTSLKDHIGEVVIIEETTAERANRYAAELGLYFDGRGDCTCCGPRWTLVEDEEATESPEVYGEAPKDYAYARTIFIHYLNGEVGLFAR